MSSAIDWSPVFPATPLLIAGLVILAALLYLELQRRQRVRMIRMLCQVLIVTSVLGLLLRPSFRIPPVSRPVVLLTPGHNSMQVDSLLALHGDLTLLTTNDSIEYDGRVRKLNTRELRSLTASPLWISGEGLPPYALPLVPVDFHFLPPVLRPDGIVSLNYRKPVTASTRQSIAITYHNQSRTKRFLRLTGPGGLEDSAKVDGYGDFDLSLGITPRIDGRTMYKVEETDSAGTVFRTSRLPIYVEKMKTIDVVIVTDHPSFEVRYLKNFLANRGHRVAFRSRVSKDRFHQEFANRPRESLNVLGSTLLSAADILLIDHSTYLSMPASERDRISTAADEGLGVIFLSPVATTNARPLAFRKTTEPDTVRVTVAGTRFVLPVTNSVPASDIVAIVSGDNGRIVSGCHCSAGLKIGFQLLNETYQLGLQSKTTSYAELWTPLIDKVSRNRQSAFSISIEPAFPVFSDVPAKVRIIGAMHSPMARYDSILLPLAEDIRIDDVWHGRLWAAGNRWHSISADSTSIHFFDLPETEWRALRITEQVKANRAWTHRNEMYSTPETSRPVPLLFFILFVIGSGALWLVPKI